MSISLCVWGGGEVVYSILAMSLCVWGEGCVQYISHECVCVCVEGGLCTVSMILCVWGGGGGCVQYKPVCVWGGGGGCVQYISYEPVCGGKVVYVLGGGGEVVYSMHTLYVGVVPISSPA